MIKASSPAGTGAHTNYSTKSMREDGGIDVINEAVDKLAKTHVEHITQYGLGNELRLTGKHEVLFSTQAWQTFDNQVARYKQPP